MITREKIQEVFGLNTFEYGLFYLHEGALRFALSVSGSPVEMFLCAMAKAQTLCNAVFPQDGEIGVCLRFFGGKTLLSALGFFRNLRDCGVTIPNDRVCWCTPDPEEADCYSHFILFTVSHASLTSLLWGAIAQDLGIRPRILGSVYLFHLEAKVLVHPYDDRGMDIIGPNRQLLKQMYYKYNHWLLDYNRQTMADVYGKSSFD